MSRFLINKNGVYYLTTGKLLEYDPVEAKGNPEKENGVAHVEREFNRIKDLPHTWYQAVQITDASFAPINTNQRQ